LRVGRQRVAHDQVEGNQKQQRQQHEHHGGRFFREFGNAQRSALKILAERIEHYIEMRVLMDTQYKIIEYLRTNDERIQTSLYSAEIGTWDWDIINDRLIGDAHYAKLLNISEEKAGSGFAASTMFENIHDDDRQRGYDYLMEFFIYLLHLY